MGDTAGRAGDAGLAGILADLARLSDGRERVSLGEIFDVLGARGHGPIILTLAAFLMLPTGMIPMMPALVGLLFALTALEMLLGDEGLSMPARLRRVTLDAATFRSAIDRSAPFCARLGRVLRPNWPGLVHGTLSLAAIALVLLLASAGMILIGAVPGLPFVFALPALFYGLGLTSGDGRVVAVGHLSSLAAFGVGTWSVSGLARALFS